MKLQARSCGLGASVTEMKGGKGFRDAAGIRRDFGDVYY